MGSKKESEDLFMRKSMKKVAAAILSAAMVVSMAACGADSGEQTGGSDGGDSVKVGLLHSMSGSMVFVSKISKTDLISSGFSIVKLHRNALIPNVFNSSMCDINRIGTELYSVL